MLKKYSFPFFETFKKKETDILLFGYKIIFSATKAVFRSLPQGFYF
ncbi:hypothetical protein SAMN05444412_113111 [Rhodonellum ikkaensis]|uniref:Ribosomal protein L32 n=1 Tax=Rhodonellum ikkaensis TaxID=336829 RepID=A0A1H3SUF5_9BACT|nr:hypothetical protein SAMN05444412_113111 [Rhodonellum ikkaensis]